RPVSLRPDGRDLRASLDGASPARAAAPKLRPVHRRTAGEEAPHARTRATGVREDAGPRHEEVRPGRDGERRGSLVDAPVDLEVDGEPTLDDARPQAPELREHALDEALPTETRIDGHHEHRVELIEHLFEHDGRRRRVERDARAAAELLDLLHRAVE